MATMFSDFDLSASRLAELVTNEPALQDELLTTWFADDRRPSERRRYYRLTHTAIEELHRRACSVGDLRARVDEWRLEAFANVESRDRLTHNVRATTQYLDEHGERDLIVFPRQTLEPIVERVRLHVKPQLFVDCGGIPTRVWLECGEHLREQQFIAKCHATLWAGDLMKQPGAQVEVVHSASRRIVACEVLPANFDARARLACERAHLVWTRLAGENLPLRPTR